MNLSILDAPSWRKFLERFGGHSNLGAVLKNFAWLSGDKVVRMGLQFVVGALVARHLGADGFGNLNVALALAALATVFAALGFDGILSRELVRDPERANILLGTVFFTRLGCVLVLYVLLAAGSFLEEPGERAALLIATLSVLFVPCSVFNVYFEARLQAKYTVWAANSAFILCTAVRLWLIQRDASIAAFAATYLVEPAITSAFLYFIYRRKGGRPSAWRWKADVARGLIQQSWPLMLSAIAVMIYMRVDQIMLASLRGNAEAGIFVAALRLSEVWYFIPMALSSSLLPILVKCRQSNPGLYEARLRRFYGFNAGLAYAIILVFAPIAPWLFQLIYGEGFAGADSVFRIHLWACLCVFLGVARSTYLLIEGYTRFDFFATSAGAILNIGLNFVLIPRYGAEGAAVATVVSQAASTFVSSFFWSKTRANGLLQLRAVLLPVAVLPWIIRWALGRKGHSGAGTAQASADRDESLPA